MKRTLLTIMVTLACVALHAQAVVYVTAPASLEGSYESSWAAASSGWGTPDMNDPANAIEDTLEFVNDGSNGDSLGCNPLINNLTGKIAVVYRGDCEFGAKSLNAQNAGAVAVIVINNVSGSPITMGDGAFGGSVTIPVFMITDVAGAQLKDSIAAGVVTAYLGSKNGFFSNDVGMRLDDILRPKSSAIPQLLATDDTEWSVELGGWVRNFGSQAQAAVSVSVDIELNGSSVFSQTSNPVSLNPGDSVFVTLPVYSQPVYAAGMYEVTYNVDLGSADEFPADNEYRTDFFISDTLFAYAPIADSTKMPITTSSFRPSTAAGDFNSCINFRNDNASRMQATGITITASGGSNGTLVGEPVDAQLWEWNDEFTGFTDPNIGFNNLLPVSDGFGTYTYLSDLQNERIFIPFDKPVALRDSQRYLFCATAYSGDMFLGYNTSVDYIQNLIAYDQPVTIVFNGTAQQWFATGFGADVIPSIGAIMEEKPTGIAGNTVSDITAYPNPARNVIQVPYGKISGDAALTITDMTGKRIRAQTVNLDGSGLLRVDISDIAAGLYLFNLTTEDGKDNSFKVLISR